MLFNGGLFGASLCFCLCVEFGENWQQNLWCFVPTVMVTDEVVKIMMMPGLTLFLPKQFPQSTRC